MGHNYRDLERLILLQLPRDDHRRQWDRAEIEAILHHAEPLALSDAMAGLHVEGCIDVSGERIAASAPVQHLDALDLVNL